MRGARRSASGDVRAWSGAAGSGYSPNAKTIIFVLRLVVFSAALQAGIALAQSNSIIMGYSGSGITSDLRRVIEKEKLWDKHGVNVKAIYFNSGSVMTQAIAGGNINISDSDLPAMLNLSVSGVTERQSHQRYHQPPRAHFRCPKQYFEAGGPQREAHRRQPDRISLRHRHSDGDTPVESRS